MSEQKKKWVMPEWMEPFREMISVGDERKGSTTSIEDLMNDTDTNYFNNAYRMCMIVDVTAKILLLGKLHKKNLLKVN